MAFSLTFQDIFLPCSSSMDSMAYIKVFLNYFIITTRAQWHYFVFQEKSKEKRKRKDPHERFRILLKLLTRI